jgi:hypothetical protein
MTNHPTITAVTVFRLAASAIEPSIGDDTTAESIYMSEYSIHSLGDGASVETLTYDCCGMSILGNVTDNAAMDGIPVNLSLPLYSNAHHEKPNVCDIFYAWHQNPVLVLLHAMSGPCLYQPSFTFIKIRPVQCIKI